MHRMQTTYLDFGACVLYPSCFSSAQALPVKLPLSCRSAVPEKCPLFSLKSRLCWDTQAHSMSVCTGQVSGFLWSCHPGLAGEQLWSPISVSLGPARALNLGKCHQLVNVPSHMLLSLLPLCSVAFYWGSVSGQCCVPQSCTCIQTETLHPFICLHMNLNSMTYKLKLTRRLVLNYISVT